MSRFLVPSAALLWGLQFALLNPALALLLVTVYNADPTEVGVVLAVYNGAGFLASLVIPMVADRRGEYLGLMLVCGLCTLALAAALLLTTSLPLVVIALAVLGAPAGVGNSLLFAHLKHTGSAATSVINVRAITSFAWVAGPPLATVVITTFGERAVLGVLAAVAAATVAVAAGMLTRGRRERRGQTHGQAHGQAHGQVVPQQGAEGQRSTPSRVLVVGIVVVFICLQAANISAVTVMSLFVSRTVGLDLVWAGVALGVAAGLEIPALLLVGRATRRWSQVRLLIVGCLLGVAYYAVMTQVHGPVLLLSAQVLNAGFFAIVVGVGLTLFQELIPRPGLASGLFTNTRRLAAVLAGPVIALGAGTAAGYRGVMVLCLGLIVLGLAGVLLVARRYNQQVRTAHDPGLAARQADRTSPPPPSSR